MSAAAARAPERVVEQALARGPRRRRRRRGRAARALGLRLEARVRGAEIDFVKQARERTLGIRALVRGAARLALGRDLDERPLRGRRRARWRSETVELARATAEDPAAGLPEDGFADPAGRARSRARSIPRTAASRVEGAHRRRRARAEAAARAVDPRIENSEGSQRRLELRADRLRATARGFAGRATSRRSHALFSEPIARENGRMQRDYWLSARAPSRATRGSPAAVGRRAARARAAPARRAPRRRPARCR